MIRRPPRSTPLYSSAASDVYKRQAPDDARARSVPSGFHKRARIPSRSRRRSDGSNAAVQRQSEEARIRETPGSAEFLRVYTEALSALNEAAGVVPEKGKTTPGTFGWLTARYLASDEFKR